MDCRARIASSKDVSPSCGVVLDRVTGREVIVVVGGSVLANPSDASTTLTTSVELLFVSNDAGSGRASFVQGPESEAKLVRRPAIVSPDGLSFLHINETAIQFLECNEDFCNWLAPKILEPHEQLETTLINAQAWFLPDTMTKCYPLSTTTTTTTTTTTSVPLVFDKLQVTF